MATTETQQQPPQTDRISLASASPTRTLPYDLQPKIGHRYESPSPPPARGKSAYPGTRTPASAASDVNNSYTARPKTSHAGSGRNRSEENGAAGAPDWPSPKRVIASSQQEQPQVPASPSIRPMTSIYRRPGQPAFGSPHESTEMFERTRSRNSTTSPTRELYPPKEDPPTTLGNYDPKKSGDEPDPDAGAVSDHGPGGYSRYPFGQSRNQKSGDFFEDSRFDPPPPRPASTSFHTNGRRDYNEQHHQEGGGLQAQGVRMSPTFKYQRQDEDIQPKIGHHYMNSRSPSPSDRYSRGGGRYDDRDRVQEQRHYQDQQRPRTSRPPPSQMPDVDVDMPARGRSAYNGRRSSPERNYIENNHMSNGGGRRSNYDRGTMSHSYSSPHVSNYNNQNNSNYNRPYSRNEDRGYDNNNRSRRGSYFGTDHNSSNFQNSSFARRMEYSRHLNGRNLSSRNQNYGDNSFSSNSDQDYYNNRPGSRMRGSASMHQLSNGNGNNNGGNEYAGTFKDVDRWKNPRSDWNLSTTKRTYR